MPLQRVTSSDLFSSGASSAGEQSSQTITDAAVAAVAATPIDLLGSSLVGVTLPTSLTTLYLNEYTGFLEGFNRPTS